MPTETNVSVNHFSSIAEVSRLVATRAISPVTLVTECLERIKTAQPAFNSFITVMADQSLAGAHFAAEEIKSGHWWGPLHGIPVAVKDFYDTANIRTTAAFEHFKNRVPKDDSAVVARLKAAGAIIIGKTNMDALGMGTTGLSGYFGPVHNPWDDRYITGGSSAGSAAAVAAGLCFATVDTDAIGSCRLPAACCGVTGFKVSPGLISQQGILGGEKADDVIICLSQTGLTTRSLEDTAILLNTLADPAVRKSPSNDDYQLALRTGNKLAIGIAKNFKASPEIREAFLAAVEVIGSLGYPMTEVDIPLGSVSFDIKNIEEDRQNIKDSLFKTIDALLLPTTTDITLSVTQAKEYGPQALSADNTMFCNYFGLPAVSVPCGFDRNGLPIGLQIASWMWGETNVLAVAHTYQQATEWHLRHPSQLR